jgi:hypothetical protein
MSTSAFRITAFAFAALLLLTRPVLSERPASAPLLPKSFDLGDFGSIEFSAPPEWDVKSQFDRLSDSTAGLTLKIDSEAAGRWSVLATALFNKKPHLRKTTKQLRDDVSEYSKVLRGQVIESEILPQELRGKDSVGYYISVTDPKPKPGEFTNMVQGMLQSGEIMISFTVLSNGDRKEIEEVALRCIASARYTNKP